MRGKGPAYRPGCSEHDLVEALVFERGEEERAAARETDMLLPNNQRQHRTSHDPKDVLTLRICAAATPIHDRPDLY